MTDEQVTVNQMDRNTAKRIFDEEFCGTYGPSESASEIIARHRQQAERTAHAEGVVEGRRQMREEAARVAEESFTGPWDAPQDCTAECIANAIRAHILAQEDGA